VFAYSAFEMFRTNTALFSDVFGFQSAGQLHAAVGNDADLAGTEVVSGNYFSALGVSAAAGRVLLPDDDRAGAPPVTVMSDGFARRFFGSAEAAVGRQIALNGRSFTVAGVTSPEFSGVDPGEIPAIYIPMHAMLFSETDAFHTGAFSFTDPN